MGMSAIVATGVGGGELQLHWTLPQIPLLDLQKILMFVVITNIF